MVLHEKVVFFDDNCNLCNHAVNFIISRDLKKIFKFASLNSEAAKKLLNENSIKDIDSIILIENGKTYTYSTAILRIAKNLSGLWKLFYVLVLVPKPMRDFLYKILARYRYKFFGQSCLVLTPEIKERFLK
ncbi:MAG: DCC1-like thiol-disulfide oxidoreductase family protein [Pyrinomonadaceae bacterium]|nr:DCC1-like thiol-disulfide oxidoreductase family protein [Pyrinomonadaceae bacterium]MCX7640171.1 DCC1-like thiol-disulfide oxidoreductase family protein [Pyrinomonadaceae bacterium]MDW8303241.1 DCC1-like thiol-disulfide oxidoreductase family protein [Acidobacteriota bacterium]